MAEHVERRPRQTSAGPSTERPDDLLHVGTIGRPHGLHGDVYVDLVTDRTERLAPGTRLWTNATSDASEARLRVVRSKPANHRFLVSFDGVDDRETAARYNGTLLYAEPIDDPEALWVHELVGAPVVTPDGVVHGTCVAVVANPASDLLELDSGVLIPSVFVTGIDDGTVVVEPPPGLLNDE